VIRFDSANVRIHFAMTPMTLQSLAESLPQWANRPALGLRGECGSRWLSYSDLFGLSCKAAQAFAARNLPAQSRVILWADNSPEWVACLLGAAFRGLVVLAVDSQTSPEAVAKVVAETGAALVVFGAGQDHGNLPVARLSLMAIEDGEPGAIDELRVPVEADSPAVVVFTSGSTGHPRGVILTHRNVVSQLQPFARFRAVTRIVPIRLLALSPLSHVQGLVLGACLPLYLGLSTLYAQSVAPGYLISALRIGRIGILLAVPRILEVLEERLEFEVARRFGSHRLGAFGRVRAARKILGMRFSAILVGGATFPAARERFWQRMGCLLIQGYGATETTALATMCRPFLGSPGSVGYPIHADSIRLAEDGEILVRGPHLSAGYLDDERRLDQTPDGYFRTGDLGEYDAEGRIVFLGRKREIIVTAEGNNIHPAAIESVLEQCDGVRAAVVTGRKMNGLEEIHAVLLLRVDADPATAVHSANRILPPWQRIRGWSIWPQVDFPRGALGKVRRKEVATWLDGAAAYQRDTPDETRPQLPSLESCLAEPDSRRRIDALSRYLLPIIAGRTAAEIAAETRNLGLDSMETIRLLSRIEEQRMPGSGESIPARSSEPVDAIDFQIARPERRRPQEKAPAWQYWPGVQFFRSIFRSLTLDLLIPLRGEVEVDGLEYLAGLRAPFLVTLSPADRQHPTDYLAVYKALPRRFSRRLLFVMRSTPPDGFAPYLHGTGQVSPAYRLLLAALFHVGASSWFPFALFPTVEPGILGLARVAGGIDRGYQPVAVWGRGTALLAAETRATVVPVRLTGNDSLKRKSLWPRPRVRVAFGEPIHPGAVPDPIHLLSMVERRLKSMRERAPAQKDSA